KKCMPSTRSGRFVAPAISTIGMDDVLDASTTSGRVTRSSPANTRRFSSATSTTASTTRSVSASASRFVDDATAARTRSRVSASSLPRSSAGYLIVGVGVLFERSMFIGLIVPGDVILALGGVYASQGKMSVVGVAALGTAAAVCGESAGYWLGRKVGLRLIRRVPVLRRFE